MEGTPDQDDVGAGPAQATERSLLVAILCLAAAIPLVNAAAFVVYRRGYPDGAFWTQLWEYLDSDPFNVITISLLLALILALVEQLFNLRGKLAERVQQERKDRRTKAEQAEQHRKERVAKEHAAWQEARRECAKSVSKLWFDLYELTTQVRYFVPDPNDAGKATRLLSSLRNYHSHADRVIVDLDYLFSREITPKDVQAFLTVLNVQRGATITVATSLRGGLQANDRDRLQECLHVIQSATRHIAHQPFLAALGEAIRRAETGEDPSKGVAKSMADLRQWGSYFRAWMMTRPVVSGVEGGPAIDHAVRNLTDWSRDNLGRPLGESPAYAPMRKELDGIATPILIPMLSAHFSHEGLQELARLLAYTALELDIRESAQVKPTPMPAL